MTPEQITSLAREYAEEIVQDTDSYPELPISLLNEMRKEVAEDFEEKIRFLLRRYCLVEKEKVRKEHEDSYRQYLAAGNARPLRQQYFFGRCFALEFLFPDLGKEVKG